MYYILKDKENFPNNEGIHLAEERLVPGVGENGLRGPIRAPSGHRSRGAGSAAVGRQARGALASCCPLLSSPLSVPMGGQQVNQMGWGWA